jgi:hypothetical protein
MEKVTIEVPEQLAAEAVESDEDWERYILDRVGIELKFPGVCQGEEV